jgi:hypothetical protein
MDSTKLLDYCPLWGLFVATVAIVILSVEGGFRLGKYRRRRSDQEKDAPVGAIVAATLGLLAFMLAFTFGLAATRFDARRMVVLEESNAIGTAYLRAGLLPEPHRAELRRLLREYVDARLHAVQSQAIEAGTSKSADLHHALWSQTTQVAAMDSRSILTGLFIQSLNEVIDLHSKRVLLGLRNRISEIIWLALYFIAILAMGALGYQEGLAGSRRSLAVLALALTFSAVMLLIADLDRPAEGLLRVSQQALVDLQNSLIDVDLKSTSGKP